MVAVGALAAACGTDHALAELPDAGGADSAFVEEPLDCTDLDSLIDLPGQVAANAGAHRGLHPLVLAHGMGGFDQVGPLAYFGDAPATLRAAGFAVYVTAVEPIASTETTRGPELGRQIACIAAASGAAQVNLIGHSQGGLDARFVAADPRWGRAIASVTTIGSPHRGVVVADMALGVVPTPGGADALFDALSQLYGGIVGAPDQDAAFRAALEQMSTAGMVAFAERYPDAPGVPYFSWAGRAVDSVLREDTGDDACGDAAEPNPPSRDVVDPLLLLTFGLSGAQSVPNDGLVSVASARWGTFMGCIPADHLDEVGLLFDHGPDPVSGFDHAVFFLQLAESLVAAGL